MSLKTPSLSKKLTTLALVGLFALTWGVSAASAEMTLNANDLTAATLTSPLTADAFEITAKSDKDVQIKALGIARTADDGEIFNNCIDLRGTGSADFRSVKFSTNEGALLTLYLNSGNSSAARVLRLVSGDGTIVLEIPAKPYVEGKAEKVTVTVPVGGNLYLTSSSGGILLYQIQLN